ncbi:MAG: M16 family metallopeptidase [Nitrospiraceae bacterium]
MTRRSDQMMPVARLWFIAVLITLFSLGVDDYLPALALAEQNISVAAPSADPRQMHFEPVEFHPPDPDRIVMENGMVVYLLEDHELPLITISATVKSGGWLDPSERVGLASITGATMRSGGTQHTAAADLDEELERLAAQLSVAIGVESGVATLDVLQKDVDRGLRILADVLRAPAFEPARLELAKLQAKEMIRRRQDKPQSIAGREFAKLVYGPTHPFARESSVESISRISRDDVLAFHAATVHPNGIILGVTGDFVKADMLAKLRDVFGDWKQGKITPVVFPPVTVAQDRDLRFIGKGTTQTHLRAGHLTLKENDPDYAGLVLLNDILGGGSFRSRLFQDVRTKQGLAYSVGSVLRVGSHAQGVWAMRTETKTASTRETITRLMANVERLREQPVTDEELQEAKDAFVNSFVFSFTSPASIVNHLVELEYDGLPKDFLQQLRDRVMKLTKDDLLRMARVHFHPDRMKILAVGPPETAAVLSSFGEVAEIKLQVE